MIRNLKALGLALMAAFALSAVGATAAQATPDDLIVDAPGAVTVTGEQLEILPNHKDHTFTLSSGRGFTCGIVTADGTVADGDNFITVTPTYGSCFSNEIQPITITGNGCSHKLHGGNLETPGTHAFKEGTVDLECPAGKQVEVHVYSNHHSHTTGTSVLCTYNIAPFQNKLANTYENTTTPDPDDIDVTTTAEGIVITRVTGSALVCGSLNQTAVHTGATTLTAYSDTAHNNQVSISLVDPTHP